MHILLLFIDGFGLGEADSAQNPLARFHSAFFHSLLHGSLTKQCSQIISDVFCLIPVDATLGVSGLPQSATGQTTLFTGVNAAKHMGHHVSAFPGPQLAKIIAEHGILRQLQQQGYGVTSANAYLSDYFQLVASRKRRHSATTLAILGAGLSLRSIEDIKSGQAIYQDITNEMLGSFGITDIPVIDPWQAGVNLAKLVKQYDLTLFEYFQTDRIGHKQNWLKAELIIKDLDGLLCGFWQACQGDCTLILTSDHGNFEDLSVKTHTLNQVPLLIVGAKCREIARQITDLTSITPAILSVMQEGDD
jgi:2,3-bisphosphoglycerate-independent phosphoglycerate mutase